MKRLALLLIVLLAACTSHEQTPESVNAYLDHLTAYYANLAHELPATGLLAQYERIDSISHHANPYPVDLALGREVYRTRCAPCHGSHGQGAPVQQQAYGNVVAGPPLDRPDVREEYSLGTIAYVSGETAGRMTQLGPMTDEERWQVAAFVQRGEWP